MLNFPLVYKLKFWMKQYKNEWCPPEAASLQNLAGAKIPTGVAIAGINLVLTVGAIVSWRTDTLIATVGQGAAGGTILTRMGVAQVTFGQHLQHKHTNITAFTVLWILQHIYLCFNIYFPLYTFISPTHLIRDCWHTLEGLSGCCENQFIPHGWWLSTTGNTRLKVTPLHPVREPGQGAVTIERVGSHCSESTTVKSLVSLPVCFNGCLICQSDWILYIIINFKTYYTVCSVRL